MKPELPEKFSKNSPISNVVKTCPVEYELILVDRRTDRQARRS